MKRGNSLNTIISTLTTLILTIFHNINIASPSNYAVIIVSQSTQCYNAEKQREGVVKAMRIRRVVDGHINEPR